MYRENPLSKLELFKETRPETLQQLWRQGKVKLFPKQCVVMRAREPLKSVYIQLTGKSIIYNLTHNGKRKIIFIFGTGTLLNEHVLDTHNGSLFCETIETSRIFVISVCHFLELMEKDFGLTKAVLVAQEKKVWRMGHQLKNTMGSIYMERKLAAKLWKLSRDFGKGTQEGIEIDINLSITFLADMLGAPRETTSRLCGTLADLGLIRMERKRITILDADRMSRFYKTGQINEEL
ncbi:MAG: Crp/Fnr family transcriptional regulator [Lachnospiraceae bacterium]|jgi:CRP/FNR family cyclic AMP-dependent transcriptional regulator|nr:Crp/Fnr family transcriptional regulator [Lachnospiraceae bacterium]